MTLYDHGIISLLLLILPFDGSYGVSFVINSHFVHRFVVTLSKNIFEN
jgi:hypothetical protein